MKLTKLSILAIISILVMVNVTVSTAVISVNQAGNFSYANDVVEIKVTGNGNVPKYTITLLETGEAYNLGFTSIFTAEDVDGDGLYNPQNDNDINSNNGGFSKSLSSSVWTFSDVTNRADGGAEFDITSQDLGSSASANYQNAQVTLKNRVTGDDATEIKFDVVLNGFDFSNAPDNTILVFSYMITARSGQAASSQSNQVNVGNSYFSSEPSATDENGQVDVGFRSNSENSQAVKVYISYPAFTGELVHDPTMGVQTSTGDDDDKNNGANLADEEGAPVSFGFVLAGIAILPILRRKE